jgi:hypothetical protein
MERQLPTTEIEGTTFFVDVSLKELREAANPENTISILDMRDMGTHYAFEYDRMLINLPGLFNRDADIVTIELPQLIHLDPVGMAEKYGKTVFELEGKTDFDLMVDQEVLAARLQGRLTTIDIADHLFYVDIPMDCLRPKDDFSTLGINFTEIEDYLHEYGDRYLIPYNPKTHEFEQLDYENIIAIPTEIIVVEIPHEQILDPVGYARKYGLDQRECLRATPIQSHFVAQKINWMDTRLPEIIRLNLQKKPEPDLIKKRPEKKARRGRRM